jgi:hypothetical protein
LLAITNNAHGISLRTIRIGVIMNYRRLSKLAMTLALPIIPPATQSPLLGLRSQGDWRILTHTAGRIIRNGIGSDAGNRAENGGNRLADIRAAEGGFGVSGPGASTSAKVGLGCEDETAWELGC